MTTAPAVPRAEAVRAAVSAAVPAAVLLDGAELRYWTYYPSPRAETQAPVIVMVHGFRGTHRGLELIAGHLPEFRVVSPDLPGFGASPPMPGRTHDVAGYAAVIAGLIRQLAAGPVVLLGHSFGSIIAARIAATEPALVSSLVLVNPAGHERACRRRTEPDRAAGRVRPGVGHLVHYEKPATAAALVREFLAAS